MNFKEIRGMIVSEICKVFYRNIIIHLFIVGYRSKQYVIKIENKKCLFTPTRGIKKIKKRKKFIYNILTKWVK